MLPPSPPVADTMPDKDNCESSPMYIPSPPFAIVSTSVEPVILVREPASPPLKFPPLRVTIASYIETPLPPERLCDTPGADIAEPPDPPI